MQESIKRVSIFCASSPGIDEIYFNAAAELARLLVKNNISIDYGGGGVGLMGEIADTVLREGGQIRGIIPVFMKEMEWSHPEVKDMILVRDMHERKYRLKKDADAIITLPGGVGTMDELMEFITLKQLGQFTKPIIILNTNGFFDPLFGLTAGDYEAAARAYAAENVGKALSPAQVQGELMRRFGAVRA